MNRAIACLLLALLLAVATSRAFIQDVAAYGAAARPFPTLVTAHAATADPAFAHAATADPAFAGRASADPASADPAWSWPVEPPRVIVRPFLAPGSRYGSGHRGIDVAGAAGFIVRAPADGVVYFAGFIVDRPLLSIAHPGGLLSSYEPVETTLHAGDIVHRGEVIGIVIPGHCSAVCLHFGVRRDGEYVSPLNFLGGIPRSVLLPTRR
jgi:murein DD-endopeptidase MepM/ murein hydrolase activator NlpD